MYEPGKGERGYALTEVLIAAAIAGAVLAAAMSGIGSSLESVRKADAVDTDLLAAGNIAARFQAGLSSRQALDGYSGWRAQVIAVDEPVETRTGAVLSHVTLRGPERNGAEGMEMRFIVLREGSR